MPARIATFFSALALASVSLGAGTALADGSCAGGDAMPGTVEPAVIQQATLCLLNQQRAAAGEVPLVEQSQLDVASTAYSQTMVAQQFFAHVAPDGSTMTTRVTATGYLAPYAAWALGENIAWGSGSLATPNSIVVAWMNSPEHRDNILDARFREIGIGVVTGTPVATSEQGATYTTDFGARSAPKPASSTSLAGGARSEASASVDTVGTQATTSATKAVPSRANRQKKAMSKKAAKARAAKARRARASRARRASHRG